MRKSNKWKMWDITNDLNLCKDCKEQYGKIYAISETPNPKPPLHPHCRCKIRRVDTLLAGTATDNGTNSADWYLKYLNKLPNYYISRELAETLGWKPKKANLHLILPKKMLFDTFENRENKLPQKQGRIWYEADINYVAGKRNNQRIVYSNDGLIFVTYDHYVTFIEIV